MGTKRKKVKGIVEEHMKDPETWTTCVGNDYGSGGGQGGGGKGGKLGTTVLA